MVAAWILLLCAHRSSPRLVKSFSSRLVAVVWLMAALSLVGWLIVNLDTAGWILLTITTGLMTFELTRKPVHRGGLAKRPEPRHARDERSD